MLCFLPVLALIPVVLQPVSWPQTRAERSNYTETSTYADVMEFIHALQRSGSTLKLQFIGESAAGKRIPLCIFADSSVASASDARSKGKLVAYIQANIHAGEVEGKEATLAFMRELSQGKHKRIADNFVLLICPIYNIDGNDNMADGVRNRPSQDGPALVGQRASGQGFDLNRDCIKAESLEMRAVLEHVYAKWNPDIVMDLHTTNGTRHAFPMTYSPPLNPNTDAGILRFTRDQLLPHLRSEFKKAGLPMFDYGNVGKIGDLTCWQTFGWEGRYVSNYVGLRNRIGVLTEAASFQPFKLRVEATHKLAVGVLDYTSKRAQIVKELVRMADLSRPKQLGVRFEMTQGRVDAVELEDAEPGAAIDHTKAPTKWRTLKLPIYDRFITTKYSDVPQAYLIPTKWQNVADLLRRHGIIVEKLIMPLQAPGTEFLINAVEVAQSAFQGHRLVSLSGSFRKSAVIAGANDFIVRTDQPLGNLAFYLLEPESLDGVAAWNFLDPELKSGELFPVKKIETLGGAVAETLP